MTAKFTDDMRNKYLKPLISKAGAARILAISKEKVEILIEKGLIAKSFFNPKMLKTDDVLAIKKASKPVKNIGNPNQFTEPREQ